MIDPLLDDCVVIYKELDEDPQVAFKGSAKIFTRMYPFLVAIIPYGMTEWEKLSVFLTLLVPKLPSPKKEDLSKGILQAVDMDSYRAEIQASRSIHLEHKPTEIDPVAMGSVAGEPEPEWDNLSRIVAEFNKLFGGFFKNHDVAGTALPAQVVQNATWPNAKKNTNKDDARRESNFALNEGNDFRYG